jgi:hypothetical protein
VWEGWEAGIMAFHPSHTLSFPWAAFRHEILDEPLRHRPKFENQAQTLVVIVVNECIGDE